MSGSEAHAFAVLRPAGDNLARAAEELLAAVVGSFDVDAGGPALADLRQAVAVWRDAIASSDIAAKVPVPPAPGKEHAVAQAISSVDVTLAEGTAWTETGAEYDGAGMVVLTVIVGVGDQADYEAGKLETLHFAAPWPNARPVFRTLARKIRGLG